MRYLPFTLWAAVTVVFFVFALSDAFFGKANAKQTVVRMALAVFWPVALLSRSGRQLLLAAGRGL
jgi:hypothetical protein